MSDNGIKPIVSIRNKYLIDLAKTSKSNSNLFGMNNKSDYINTFSDKTVSSKNKISNDNNNNDDQDDEISKETLFSEIYSSIKRDKKAVVGGVIIFLFIFIALFAPFISPHDPYLVDMDKTLLKPSSEYLLGTDFLGRDILSRMIFGARISLIIGLVPTTISMTIGTSLGMIAGYYGGKKEYIIMRMADVCMSFPSILLAMVVMYTLGSSLFNIFIALSIVGWGGTARIIRSQTLSLKEKEFVEAAKSMGVTKFKIMWRHIFPNTIPSLIVLFTLSVPGAIMSEAGLSFLGVGAQPPTPSWGLMISRGKEFLFSAPWVAIMPGVAIFIIVISFNFIGDGLRDALDPYSRN